MLDFIQTKRAIMSLLDTGHAVNVIGEAGIGKTEMMREIAREKDWNIISVTASNLKEGELSFPMLHKNEYGNAQVEYAPHHTIRTANKYYEDWISVKNKEYEPFTIAKLELASDERLIEIYKDRYEEKPSFKDGDRVELIKSILKEPDRNYKIFGYNDLRGMDEKNVERVYKKNFVLEMDEFNKERAIHEIIQAQPKEKSIYFFDEVARMAPEVQAEVMNFLLEKKINNSELPPNVVFVTAQNPSSGTEDFEDTNYHSQEMDPAVASRLFHIKMRATFDSWLGYATSRDPITDRQNVHQTVIEFISEAEDKRLFTATADNTNINNTNPRSWKHISDLIYNIEDQPHLLDRNADKDIFRIILKELIGGKINTNIANEYVDFYIDNQNPLPKPVEIFKDASGKKDRKSLEKKMKERIAEEPNNRQLVLALNCIEYLAKGNSSADTSKVMVGILETMDKDLMLHPMRTILKFSPRRSERELSDKEKKFYSDMTKNEDYVDLFNDTYEVTQKLANS